jgi:putative endonuclease
MGPLFITRMKYFVYVLQSEKDGSFYIGHTRDLRERICRHNQSRSIYTKSKLPWELVYQEVFDSKSEAMKREHELKSKKDRKYIINLVRASRV